MRVLVTGKVGQLASSLAASPRPGVEVVSIGRPELDLADARGCGDLISAHAPDIVVNAAAYTAVDKAESEPEAAMAVNARGAEAVADACAARRIPIVHISTDYVFDGTKMTPYTETDATGPVSAYGRSKLAGERLVAAACSRHLILRTAWVHSEYGNNFVKTMLRLAATRPELAVVDDQWGAPTYAPHLADAVLAVASAALRNDGPWGTYHCTGSGETTWCGLAREVFRISKGLGGPGASVTPITTAQYPTPARRPPNSRLDCSRMLRDYAVVQPHWTAGVAKCVERLIATRTGS